MARKPISSTTSTPPTPSSLPTFTTATKAAPAPTRTEVRNTSIPRPGAAAAPKAMRKQITPEMVARRAYEIWQSGKGGSEHDNWLRAERELRG